MLRAELQRVLLEARPELQRFLEEHVTSVVQVCACVLVCVWWGVLMSCKARAGAGAQP